MAEAVSICPLNKPWFCKYMFPNDFAFGRNFKQIYILMNIKQLFSAALIVDRSVSELEPAELAEETAASLAALGSGRERTEMGCNELRE